MKLSTLKGGLDTIQVPVPSEDGSEVEHFEVKWRPGALTFDMFEELQAMKDTDQADVVALKTFLLPLLAWWDIADDDGNNLSPQESFGQVPLIYLRAVLDAMIGAAVPNPGRGRTSESTSPQEVPSDPSPNGTHSSELPIASDVAPGTS